LACRLVELGVRPESRVGVLLGRGLDLVVGLLGVLQSGGAYVPLDPSYPAERLALTLSDCGAGVVVTQRALAGLLAGHEGARPLYLDEPLGEVSSLSPSARAKPCSANLAYVIYTSGSTGRPKGVALTHGNAVAMVSWALEAFEPELLRGTLAATSVCFDLSVFELFVPLSGGGTVLVAENALALPELAWAEAVTLVNTVPSAMDVLVGELGLPPGVRAVNLAGEALGRALVERVCAATGLTEVCNLYGPSEDTTYSTAAWVRAGGVGQPSIGRPLPNTEAYVLDAQLRLVPVGVSGELYLGGAGQARGYLERPELTAERFVPHPFAKQAGQRLYRTGDVVRQRVDGSLDFLGRRDQQIKLRGFRIELGEVEAALKLLPGVREAAVLALDDARGGKLLAGYVSALEGVQLTAQGVSEALAARLPAHLVPQTVQVLERLPLTPNGKLDRKALPAPGFAPVGIQLARDPLELQIVRVWEELLDVRPIGVNQSFFRLGGNSLLAVVLASRLQAALGQPVPVAALFRANTVEQLAAYLHGQAGSSAADASQILFELHPGPGEGLPLFLVHPVGGTVFCYMELAGHLSADRPVYALQAPAERANIFEVISIEEMAAQYLEELRRVQERGPYLLGGWSMGGVVAFEIARQLVAAGEEVLLLALVDSEAPQGVGAPQATNAFLLRALALDLGVPAAQYARLTAEHADVDSGLRALFALAAAAGLVTPSTAFEEFQSRADVLANHFQALAAYRPEPLDTAAVWFHALEPFEGDSAPRTESWQDWLPRVETRAVPGNHYSLMRIPNVEVLADHMRSAIAWAELNASEIPEPGRPERSSRRTAGDER
jgi:amino acid adenylation domain-containing protein